ncbi:OmpA family protein [Archangium lansingense]|uniref:OmpA family protein n=1 Tax=Archangium lansingense TaxID=2995310 RepID=A0ABT4A1B3_9BACT|nr:OmpA family protein [Archangium lansinium]MCY1075156.1 OmpA family protein [Archangium lansinium]
MDASPFHRAALALALLAAPVALAQTETTTDTLPGFELERLEPNPGRGAMLAGGGALMVPGGLRLMVLGNYQRQPLVLLDQDQSLAVVGDKVVGLLSGSYTALSWLELSAQVPVVLWQKGEDLSSAGISAPAAQGLGTPYLQARVGLLSQRERQPVDLALDVGFGLPLGNALALSRDSGLRFLARMAVGGKVGWVRPSLEAGVLLHREIPLGLSEGQGSAASPEIRVGAGLSTESAPLRAELSARATLLSTKAAVEVLGGLHYTLGSGIEVFALGGPGLGSIPGMPRFRVVAGLAYSMEPPPRLVFLEDSSSAQLQNAGQPTVGGNERGPQPVRTWDLDTLDFAEPDSQQPLQGNSTEQFALHGTVLFEDGSAELPKVLPLLDRVALMLQRLPEGATVVIEGHTDAEDDDGTDRLLSLRRAQAVRRYLTARGVSAEQLKIRGFGSKWPAASSRADEARQLNRRAEVYVLTEPPKPPVSRSTTQ